LLSKACFFGVSGFLPFGQLRLFSGDAGFFSGLRGGGGLRPALRLSAARRAFSSVAIFFN
jgi:hypothetical protein